MKIFTSMLTLMVFNLTAQAGNDPVLESNVHSWLKSNPGRASGQGGSRSQRISFEENKGQMTDQDGKPSNDLYFKTNAGSADVYVTRWGLSYVFMQAEKQTIPQLGPGGKENTSVKYCRADMELVGADIKKENCIKEFESHDRSDYYLSHCPRGILNVHRYEQIIIKNIYPGIDWVIYSKSEVRSQKAKKEENAKVEGDLKYDFIVHPGADPSLIRIRYKGTDNPQLSRDGSMKMGTALGFITEGTPVSYGSDKNQKIKTRYVVEGNEVIYKIEKYNQKDTLVIDPGWSWSTYITGISLLEVYSINTDGSHVWVTGMIPLFEFPAVPVPSGNAYVQGTMNGGGDIFIIEFSTCGALIWATYYGGSNLDQGQSISSDGLNVWVTGFTQSTDFPVSALGGTSFNQPVNNGGQNAFVLEFNANTEARVWATYIGGLGGTGDDGQSISSDGKNVWLTGSTESTNFPVQSNGGAYYQPALSGLSDVFVSQFSCLTNAMVWSTYYGGAKSDFGYGISSDGTNVWVTGGTYSTNFPLPTAPAGAFSQTLLGGRENVFVLEFQISSGNQVWGTYFGGNQNDQGNAISSDGKNVWITGQTTSANLPLPPAPIGAYSQPAFGGGTDAFILQFKTNNSSLVWASYYGGKAIDIGYSIQSDGANVWVCGATASSDFPEMSPACGHGLWPYSTGSNDVFILQFNTSGARQWATYYGFDSENDGSYICSTGSSIFVTGDAEQNGYTPFIGPGSSAYLNTNFVFGDNLFVGEFDLTCVPNNIIKTSNDTTFCSGGSAILKASQGTDFTWAPATGLNTTLGSIVVATPTVTTTYTVTGLSNSDCSTTTAAVTVTVNTLPNISITNPAPINLSCTSPNVTLNGTSTSGGILIFLWLGGGPSAANYTVNAANTYTLMVTDAMGCSATTTAMVTASPGIPDISIDLPASLTCLVSTVTLMGHSTTPGTINFQWLGGGPATANYPVTSSGTYTLEVSDGAGCSAEKTVTVTSSATPPDIQAVSSGNIDCLNSTVMLTGASSTPGVSYQWSGAPAGPGYTVSTAGTYTLTVTDASDGCTAASTVSVTSNTTIPPVSITGPTLITCAAGNNALTATSSPGINLFWNGGSLVNATNPAMISAAGNYTVTAIDPVNNCTATASLTIQSSAPVITSDLATNTCVGLLQGSITLSAIGTGLLTYAWSNNSFDKNQTGLAAGTYTVTVADPNGCSSTVSVSVGTYPAVIAVAEPNATITKGEQIQLIASGGTLFSWTPALSLNNSAISNPVASPVQNTEYIVTVSDVDGCTGMDSVLIKVIDCDASDIFVPNAFSPNGDGKNDVLHVRGPDCITEMKFTVFDRWGEMVFETTSPVEGWNGIYQGKMEDTGVYVYYLRASLLNGTTLTRKGNVTLMR